MGNMPESQTERRTKRPSYDTQESSCGAPVNSLIQSPMPRKSRVHQNREGACNAEGAREATNKQCLSGDAICTTGYTVEHTGPNPHEESIIPKADGRQRPLGIAALEDKIVQQAVVTILNQIYEVDFKGFSYGFRPGRNPHKALDARIFARWHAIPRDTALTPPPQNKAPEPSPIRFASLSYGSLSRYSSKVGAVCVDALVRICAGLRLESSWSSVA